MAVPAFIIGKLTTAIFVAHWMGFCACIYTQSDAYVDPVGIGCVVFFQLLTLVLGANFYQRQVILSLLVCVWAARLSVFVQVRYKQEQRHPRVSYVGTNLVNLFLVWSYQGLWVIVALLPTFICNGLRYDGAITTQDYIGWCIWGMGFFIEAVADYQKLRFNAVGKTKWIQTGLWRWCRHPNFLGDCLCWIGIAVSAGVPVSGRLLGWASMLSIVLMIVHLVTIAIPIAEGHSNLKFEDVQGYGQYKRTVPMILPFMPFLQVPYVIDVPPADSLPGSTVPPTEAPDTDSKYN